MYAKVDLDMLGISSQSEDDKKNLLLKQGIRPSNPSGAALTKEETEGGRQNLKSGLDANRMRTEKKIEDTSSGVLVK
ncbi:hypothetical protein S83_003847 [Arachis hypogaea]